MPVGPAPFLDRHQRSRQTALGRPLPHHLLSILRLRPDMGEAEKVERRWLAVWMRATLALGAEVHEARLVGMEREPVPIKPLSVMRGFTTSSNHSSSTWCRKTFESIGEMTPLTQKVTSPSIG